MFNSLEGSHFVPRCLLHPTRFSTVFGKVIQLSSDQLPGKSLVVVILLYLGMILTQVYNRDSNKPSQVSPMNQSVLCGRS